MSALNQKYDKPTDRSAAQHNNATLCIYALFIQPMLYKSSGLWLRAAIGTEFVPMQWILLQPKQHFTIQLTYKNGYFIHCSILNHES